MLQCGIVRTPKITTLQSQIIMSAVIEEEPASPCIGVCTLNARTGFCDGCFRSLNEIAEWMYYSPQEKRQVLIKVEKRCEQILNSTLFD